MLSSPHVRAVIALVFSATCAALYFGIHARKPGGFKAFLMAFLSGSSFMLFMSTVQVAELVKLFGSRS